MLESRKFPMATPDGRVVGSGMEWIVDAHGCRPEALRSMATLRLLLSEVVEDLRLHTVGAPLWHAFPGQAGVTGLILLSESHLACHTYPELGFAAFNLYCCEPGRSWPWAARLTEVLGARDVQVREMTRGAAVAREAAAGR
jgi:S-adenosylmethionine decarboxylase